MCVQRAASIRVAAGALAAFLAGQALSGCTGDESESVSVGSLAYPATPQELLDAYAKAVRDRSEVQYDSLQTADYQVERTSGGICLPWLSAAYWQESEDPDSPCWSPDAAICWTCKFDLELAVLNVEDSSSGPSVLTRCTVVFYVDGSSLIAETRFVFDMVATPGGLRVASLREVPSG